MSQVGILRSTHVLEELFLCLILFGAAARLTSHSIYRSLYGLDVLRLSLDDLLEGVYVVFGHSSQVARLLGLGDVLSV